MGTLCTFHPPRGVLWGCQSELGQRLGLGRVLLKFLLIQCQLNPCSSGPSPGCASESGICASKAGACDTMSLHVYGRSLGGKVFVDVIFSTRSQVTALKAQQAWKNIVVSLPCVNFTFSCPSLLFMRSCSDLDPYAGAKRPPQHRHRDPTLWFCGDV